MSLRPRAVRLQHTRFGFVLAMLGVGAAACGENVLVVDWELRSTPPIDAGLDQGGADASSINEQSESAEQARTNARERNKLDNHSSGARSTSGSGDSDEIKH